MAVQRDWNAINSARWAKVAADMQRFGKPLSARQLAYQQPQPRPPRKRAPRVLVADQPSSCFVDLRWARGVVYAEFAKGGQYVYPMTRAEAREWFESDSLGEFFNAFVRE